MASSEFTERYLLSQEFNDKVEGLIGHLDKIGFIYSNNDQFIIKRRYKLLENTLAKSKNINLDNFFKDNTVEILSGFFEDRAEELAEGLYTKWQSGCLKIDQIDQKYIENEERCLQAKENLVKSYRRRNLIQRIFYDWKLQVAKAKIITYEQRIEEESCKKEDAEIDNLELKIQIRDLNDKLLRLEEQLDVEQSMRKKKQQATERRKKMKNKRDASRSLTMQKATHPSLKNQPQLEDPYMIQEKKGTKTSEFSKFLSNKPVGRSAMGPDQRGSMNTMVALTRRDKLKKSEGRKSYAVTASFMSDTMSNWSFHPEINRDGKWKPKYDDHHNHKKLWKRMHDENQKIQSKKRLMSEEKQRLELESCTFTPHLVTSRNKNHHKTVDPEELSSRMYSYADKFKSNLLNKKQLYDQERGHEVNIQKVKGTKNKHIYLNLPNDYDRKGSQNKKRKTATVKSRRNHVGSFASTMKPLELPGVSVKAKNSSYANRVIGNSGGSTCREKDTGGFTTSTSLYKTNGRRRKELEFSSAVHEVIDLINTS